MSKPIVDKNDYVDKVINKTVFIYDFDGKLLWQEDIHLFVNCNSKLNKFYNL